MNWIKRPYSAVYLTIFTMVLALLCSVFLDHEWLLDFVDEGHFVESLTLIFYVIAIVFVIFYKLGTIKLSYRFSLVFILFAMMAREADLHKIFGMSMLKIKFWLTDAADLQSKFLSALIILAILYAIFYIILNNYKTWYNDLKQKYAYAISVLMFFIVLVVSKILDRSFNMINEITGWMAPRWMIAVQQPQEEYLECILPILIMIAVIQYIDKKYQQR
ncbi:hypothetical protein DES39_1383 [Orbus hercynius]|uniref:Uncharacterized protein n=1 Tax=Orbus hercynius TaxID=593135 RepID=A0A495RF04_9GAMM|nr:hypothetical protein [Orbus hercynius]RKS85965.1 hypothetical protein DES39_1383 [Orbus hercynius]